MKDFGVIIACYRQDYQFAKACCVSVRHFAGDVPIHLIVDGDFSTERLERAYGVTVLKRKDVKDPFLRERSFGFGLTKMVAFWESPFERFLFLDADTVMWGDVIAQIPEGDWDFIYDAPVGPKAVPRDRVAEWYFDTDRVERLWPGFAWRQYAGSLFNSGVFAGRRGIFDLEAYKRLLALEAEQPGIFKYGDQGLLNFMVFQAQDEGRIRVQEHDFQVVISNHQPHELAARFPVDFRRGAVAPSGDPKVIHFVLHKPILLGHWYPAPMSFFRLKAAADLYGYRGLAGRLYLHAEDWRFNASGRSFRDGLLRNLRIYNGYRKTRQSAHSTPAGSAASTLAAGK